MGGPESFGKAIGREPTTEPQDESVRCGFSRGVETRHPCAPRRVIAHDLSEASSSGEYSAPSAGSGADAFLEPGDDVVHHLFDVGGLFGAEFGFEVVAGFGDV